MRFGSGLPIGSRYDGLIRPGQYIVTALNGRSGYAICVAFLYFCRAGRNRLMAGGGSPDTATVGLKWNKEIRCLGWAATKPRDDVI